MATCINSSRSCLPPFYTIPIFPLLNRKIFHLLVNIGMGRRQDRDGRMDVAILRIVLINRYIHVLYCYSRPNRLYDNK